MVYITRDREIKLGRSDIRCFPLKSANLQQLKVAPEFLNIESNDPLRTEFPEGINHEREPFIFQDGDALILIDNEGTRAHIFCSDANLEYLSNLGLEILI